MAAGVPLLVLFLVPRLKRRHVELVLVLEDGRMDLALRSESLAEFSADFADIGYMLDAPFSGVIAEELSMMIRRVGAHGKVSVSITGRDDPIPGTVQEGIVLREGV